MVIVVANNNIYIKQLGNGNIYYSTTNNADLNILTGTWTQINTDVDWQVNLSNTNNEPNETNRLVVTFLSNIILNDVNNTFTINSNFVTFNGNNKTFTIDSVNDWLGLIYVNSDIGNITIQNIYINTMDSSSNTTLAYVAGYIIKSSSFTRCIGNNIIEYCTNDGIVNGNYSGGILGFSVFSNSGLSENIIRYCTNNGDIDCNDGGGLCGSDSFWVGPDSINTITDCINTGNIIRGHGLFAWNSFHNAATPINVINCANTGIISQQNNNGNNAISGGPSLESCNISNCYTLYGIIANSTQYNSATITNCYEANGNWLTTNAINILVVNYPGIWAYYKDPNTGITNEDVPFVLSSLNPTNTVVTTTNGPTGTTGPTGNVPCFKKGTKILCCRDNKEEYLLVEDLRNGYLVKTKYHGYKPIILIGYHEIIHTSINNHDLKDQLYRCSKENYPEIFEDLIITGCHSILVKDFTSDEEKERVIKVNKKIYVTDKLYRLPACADLKTNIYEIPGTYTIYHLALEQKDKYMNYGIYANGLLVESCSEWSLKENSDMIFID